MRKSIWLFLSLLTLLSCKDEPIPGYLIIDKIDLTVQQGQGTASHAIVDAWVYVNSDLQGVYELPATIPVLDVGEAYVQVRGGIKVSGLSATRAFYPFFNFYSDTLVFTPNGDVVMEPVVGYFPGTAFAWMDNFDDPGLTMETTARSDTNLQRIISGDVFEGAGSAAFYLDTANWFFECQTIDNFVLPIGGQSVFLEMNYRCNNTFVVGIIGYTGGEVVQMESLILRPREEWNKIYVNLATQVSSLPNAFDYKIFIGATLDATNDSAWVYLDNLKLVY